MLTGKTALVTGSSSGIGLAIATHLARSGARLMIHGLEDDQQGAAMAETVAAESGGEVHYCSADLSDPAQIDDLMDRAAEAFGAIDILVNNAGIQYTSPLVEFPVDKWNAILAVNLSAAFHTTKAALPAMERAGWGRIVNIASVHGLVASRDKAAYCAAKHGLVGLTKVIALEYAEKGVTANCLCPGWTDTPILDYQFEKYSADHDLPLAEGTRQLIQTKQPYPELIDPTAIGGLIGFLCSDHAKAITGVALPIDGGWTAQ